MSNKIADALKVLSDAMKNEPDYAKGWIDNIAVRIQDCMIDHGYVSRIGNDEWYMSNDAAKRFMKAAFDVEV